MVSINIISKQKLLTSFFFLFAFSNLKSQDKVVLELKSESSIEIKKDNGDSIKLKWKKEGLSTSMSIKHLLTIGLQVATGFPYLQMRS